MNLDTELRRGLTTLGLDLGNACQEGLLRYLDLMGKWNKTYNLTAIHEPGRMLTHHLLDSLAVLPHISAERLMDVGSGGGLPGIPLALAKPDMQVTLLDASQKKCAFMQQACIELGLANVEVVHERVEAFRPAQGYQQIISRAFSDLSEFVRLTGHLLAPGGQWLAMKGVYPHEELALLKGARLKRDVALTVPDLGADRHLILLEAL